MTASRPAGNDSGFILKPTGFLLGTLYGNNSVCTDSGKKIISEIFGTTQQLAVLPSFIPYSDRSVFQHDTSPHFTYGNRGVEKTT